MIPCTLCRDRGESCHQGLIKEGLYEYMVFIYLFSCFLATGSKKSRA